MDHDWERETGVGRFPGQFPGLSDAECVCVHAVVSDFSDPMDSSLPGSFVQGILQARIPGSS